MKKRISSRLLSLVLVLSLVCGLAVPAMAAPGGDVASTTQNLSFEKVDTSVSVKADGQGEVAEELEYMPTDVVRVSIVMDKPATLSAGYPSENVAANAAAVSYRDGLKANQDKVTAQIEKVTGETLDVAWNLTLAANLISANVKFAQIEEIEKIPGVKEVVIENRYEPQTASEADEPNMGTSAFMIGSNVVWANGYTGAGSKVAVIDTGIDTDHQSFAESGYNYAMGLSAEEKGMTLDEYKASVGVLTAEDVAAVADQLNVSIDPAKTYLSDKIPYAYNYIDDNYTVDHDHDSQGEHGSHVEGIAASNRFIPQDDGTFAAALESVMTQGVAPDAQIVTMKVFGAGGGAYDSDYMAAIEDAIVLGCDSANLSLGSGNPGFAFSGTYQAIMDSLTECSTVVAMSAGNSGGWYDAPQAGGVPYLYAEDVSMATNGSPGSFTNSLGVASVDNSGASGMPLKFGDITAFYTETTGYTNPPIAATIPGENNFIFFNNTAVDGDGNDLLAAYAADIAGKVVLVYRGSSSFYQKMDAAAAAGATACIIVNNQAGTINMDLSSATSTIPCVSITQADGELIKAAYETTTLSDGTEVWTGTLTVTNEVQIVPGDSEFYTISSFSSWGVPGALTLKPEISAPGGSIYAVNGAEAGGKGYELMSGTSMASPQVAGMAALVGQYVRENGLVEKTGKTARQLANSLLMSTAVPMFEDYAEYGYGYYPVIRQGAGLANVGAATTAKSYIWMADEATASAGDGKVKVELGDDPAREGVYEWSFSINNMSDEAVDYTLNTELFTQDLTSDGTYIYMDTWTTALAYTQEYTVNGEVFEQSFELSADVDMDGDTDVDDVQAILNYVAGLVEAETIDMTAADVDADGDVTSFDAYLLLTNAETSSFTVEAGESVDVTVKVALADDDKAYLDYYYNGGAYIEGYTYVMPAVTEEGEFSDVTYSIPVLGFYGSWTDASMYDCVSAVDTVYGTNNKIPYTGNTMTNGLYVRYGSDATNYWFMGNPYITEDEFPADRLAVGSDVTLYQFRYNLIRNAAALAAAITDENGKVLWTGSVSNNVLGAYYYTNGSAWRNTTVSGYTVNKSVASLGLAEGEKLTVGLYAIPEYYANPANGKLTADEFKAVVESGVLGDGASISFTAAVDNTAPVVTAVTKDLLTGDITITAQDDNYVAAVMIANASGSKILGATLPEQDAPNQVCTASVELNGANPGSKALVVVGDYAGNEAVYEIEYSSEPVSYDGNMYAFSMTAGRGNANRWVQIDTDTLWHNSSTGEGEGMETVSSSPITVTAADYVDGYVFMAAAGGFYVAPQGEWDAVQKVGKTNLTVNDMAYSTKDGVMYVLDNANNIYTMDTTTGATTLYANVTITNPRSSSSTYLSLISMACDDEGNIYLSNYGNSNYAFLYKLTADDVVDGAATIDPVNNDSTGYMYSSGYSMYNRYPGAMAWDHDADKLYIATVYSATSTDYDNRLLTVDVETGKAALATTYNGGNTGSAYRASDLFERVTGLYIVPSKATVPPVTAPTSIELSADSLTLLKGSNATLTADVYPWNLADKSVTWESSDPTVVSVEDGALKALEVGTATITATTVATPALTATCEVTVEPVPAASMSGLIYAVDGTPNWSDFSTDAPEDATVLAQGDAYFGGVLVGDTLYTVTEDTIYAVDADTFEAESLGEIASDWIYADAAAMPADLISVYGGSIVAPCMGGTYLEVLDAEAGSLSYWSGIATYYADDPMAAIALVGKTTYQGYDDAVLYYVITENGELWAFVLYNEGYLARTDLGNTGLALGNVSAVTAGAYASMIFDAETGYLFLASYAEGETAQMYAINPETLQWALCGEFGDGVWPAVSLYQYTRISELTLLVDTTELHLYAGGTATIDATVKPAEYNGGVTFTSADEEVVTVDADGVVTAVGVGETTITVETVDSDAAGTRSVVIPVTVEGTVTADAYIYAQVSTDTNVFAAIELADSSVSAFAEAPAAMVAGGMGAATVFGVDAAGKMYEISAANDFTVSDSYNFNTNYLPIDVANYPSINVTVEDTVYQTAPGATFFTAGQYLMSMDPVEGKLSGFNLSTWNLGFAGIAFGGYFDDEDGTNLVYYAVTQTGDVYILTMYGTGTLNSSGTAPSMTVSRSNVLTNLGVSFTDLSAVSLAYYKDEYGTVGLIVADNTDQMLYWAPIDADGNVAAAGPVAPVAGCTNLAGLFFDWDTIGDLTASAGTVKQVAAAKAMTRSAMAVSAAAQAPAYFTVGETANAVTGSTNAGHGVQTKAMVRSAAAAAADAVTVEITEDVDATNGKYVVTYNPEDLTFVSATSDAMNAVNAAEGTVTVAVASAEAIAAGDAIATLTFARNTTGSTTVTVTTEELNDELALDASEDLVLESTVHECPKVFDDVKVTDWFHEAVDYVVANGIMVGVSDTSFAPNAVLTRAQMVTILYRMAGTPESETNKSFSDVKEGAWYYDAVQWAVANGVTNGMGDGTFAPNKEMTRVELVAFLAKYAKLEGKYVAADADLTVFTDADQVAAWATEYMNWAVANGLINGSNGKLNPKGTATRAQVAKVIMTYLETI